MRRGASKPQRSQNVEQLEQRNSELAVLFETVRDLVSTLSVSEVIERLLERTLGHLDSEIGSILLVDENDELHISVARGLPRDVIETARVPFGQGISGFVARTGQSLLIPDIEADARFRRRNHERYYTNSCISAPLLVEGESRGVINVNNKRSRRQFDAADLRLLEAIAGHAAIALRNARRYEEVLQQAQRDSLTGLANHGHFWATLETEARRARRYHRDLSVVMLDVDHFKRFNDEHGHLAGDRALATIARLIRERSRSHDLVARYGGEEFAVALPEADAEGAAAFGEKIRQAVEAHDFGEGSGDAAGLTVSLGVASLPADGKTPNEVAKAADDQLYRAKSLGRNCLCATRS